ncbi:lipopolysaccharide biosynthesis protein [Vibrio breoganii]|uniref:lipopolysaccharide biosynthesis protein n=1 Tax=Vibrio breoganii TaxID=553239 RepID=UPI000C83E939|nr:lipopolysaccharide biosynthesis protein [Vibrio breoganii]
MNHSKKQIKSGFIWSALDSFGNQAIGLIVSLILANILGPAAYGLVAMLTIFMAIASVFVNSGFNSALIRKATRTEKDYSTTFYFSFSVSVICYSLLFFCAPLIANFYEQPELIPLTRVIALNIIIHSFAIIPRTKLTVALNFKSQAKANIVAVVCSGTVGLVMAFNDYGVWSLVFQNITSATVSVIMFNLLSPWRPVEKFCKQAFKELFGFGSKLLVSGLIDTIYNNLYGLIIGKQFNNTQLGLFNQANSLSMMPATLITTVVQKVTYPLLSSIQDDKPKLDRSYLLTLKLATTIVFPVMLGISIISTPLVSLLLGEAWQGSAVLISILSIGMAVYPINAINLNMLQVKGRSDLLLQLEIIKKVIITIVLFITVPMGVLEMCIGMVATRYIAIYINTYYTSKLSSISQRQQLTALLPIVIITIISAIAGYVIGIMISENITSIVVMLTVALSCYASMMLILQKSLVLEIKKIL